MKKAVLSNRIYLSRTQKLHEYLVNELTYKLPPRVPKGNPEIICDVTRINRNIITIPIGCEKYIPEEYEIIDKRNRVDTTFPKFAFELRKSQLDIYNKVEDNCIIVANPGWGKTFCAINILTKLQQKTLIVVNTIDLREQWIKEIKKCLGIYAGVVGSNKFNINSNIVVANVQTLRNKVSEIVNSFGTMIVDESHHTPAPVFKTIVDAINCRYKLGLTATPYRKDGRHVLLGDYFSRNWFFTEDENRLNPTIVIINTNIEISSNSMIPWAKRLNELYNNPEYTELVLNIADIQAKKGHLVLVVADRVEFLYLCANIMHENSMVITGATENRDFINSGKKILFATTKIFSEGIDMPQLSSVVLAVPINNDTLLEQLIGRACRISDNKKLPEIVDIVLSGRTGTNQARNRLGFYIRNGYKIVQL